MIELLNTLAHLWWSWVAAMFWQVGLLIVLIACIDRLIRRWAWPQLRYALWSLVLIKLILPPMMSLPSGIVPELRPMVAQVLSRMEAKESVAGESAVLLSLRANMVAVMPVESVPPVVAPSGGQPESLSVAEESSTPIAWQVYAMMIWFVGTLILGIWLLFRLRSFAGRHGYQAAAASLPQSFYNRMAGCAKRLGLRRIPQVVVTRRVATPAVFGVFRPILLMPKGYLRGLSRKDIEHMLLHELAHIKRGDLLMHGLYMLLQIVHWYNPLLWLVRRQLHHLRELSCDATVAELLREQTSAYRQTLLETARRLLATSAEPGLGLLGLFEDSNRLAVRLNWLAKPTWRYKTMKRATVVTIVALMFTCVLPMAQGQDPIVVEVQTEEKTEQKQDDTQLSQELQELQARLEKLEVERRKLQKELQSLAQSRQAAGRATVTTAQVRVQAARSVAQARAQATHASARAAVAQVQATQAEEKAKRVVVTTAPRKGVPPTAKATSGRAQLGMEKQWQKWAQEMEVWGRQMEQWQQSEAMRQWQADMEQWQGRDTMKQWGKEQAQAYKKTGQAPVEVALAPTPAMPVMPAMPAAPSEVIAPVMPQLTLRPMSRTTSRKVVVPKVVVPKLKVSKTDTPFRSTGEVWTSGPKDGKWIEASTAGEYIVKSLKPGATFEVSNRLGSVNMTAGKGPDCLIKVAIKGKGRSKQEAEAIAEKVEVRITPAGDKMRMDAKLPNDIDEERREKIQVDFEVALPPGVNVLVTQKVGNIYLSALDADTKAITEVGDIYTKDLRGNILLRIKVGNIEMRTPTNVSAKVEASACVGSVSSDLPLDITGAAVIQAGNVRSALGSTASGVLGAGQNKIHLDVNVGSIQIRSAETSKNPPKF